MLFKELHKNGKIWIEGTIKLLSEDEKKAYNYRQHPDWFDGQPWCRIGMWRKYYANGQLHWEMEYDLNGKYIPCKRPSYRKDGSVIQH